MNQTTAAAKTPFHIMTKPIGPICNLDCEYCFYLEKEGFYDKSDADIQAAVAADQAAQVAPGGGLKLPGGKLGTWAMDPGTLDAYIKAYIQAQPGPEIPFAWQGGEPTLLGVDFFRKVVELQEWYKPEGARISNAFQTNGTLLNDEWGEFLAKHGFLVGLSVDGPEELHDRYRVDKGGKATHARVLRGLGFLTKHGVEFNTLTVVNRLNSQHPRTVYRFLRDLGSPFMQFIPLVERESDLPADERDKHDLAEPPQSTGAGGTVTGWSVPSEGWGDFLSGVWDEWIKADVGKVFVNLFDIQLGLWAGMPATLCVFAEECGKAMALEHNGDLYACDHYVYPEYKVGNILQEDLGDMVNGAMMEGFGKDKKRLLPRMCRECDYRFACNGECPKHRFLTTPDGEAGLNYLCSGYLKFFRHIERPMKMMVDLLKRHQPPAAVMDLLKEEQARARALRRRVKPNDPCPCGSGRKFKVCHGRPGAPPRP